jgi:hypothetical protein
MAVQYRRLLFKYVDKVVFVAFLVFFLVTAFKLVMKAPPPAVPVSPMPNTDFTVPEEVYKERFVLNAIKNPYEPDATHDFTSDPEKIEPGRGEKQCPQCGWIVVRSAAGCPHCGYSWFGEVVPPDGPGDVETEDLEEEGVPFKVVQIDRKPVDILFMGFIENPFKLRYDIQINWGKGEKTSIVPLGETFHGYRLYPLDKRIVQISELGLPPRHEERYFLTIKKPGEDPLVVERGETVRENEAFAILNPRGGMWKVRHRGELIDSGDGYLNVYGGYTLEEVGGKGRTYEITIVRDTEVVVKNGVGEETTLKVL